MAGKEITMRSLAKEFPAWRFLAIWTTVANGPDFCLYIAILEGDVPLVKASSPELLRAKLHRLGS